MNTEKTSLENENHPSCLGDVISRFNSDTFIDNVCLSYRHDFGINGRTRQAKTKV